MKRHMVFRLAGCCLLLTISLGCMRKEEPTGTERQEPPAQEGQPGTTESPVTAEEVQQELGEAGQALQAYSAQQMEEAVRAARRNLDDLDVKIAKLKQNVNQLQESGRAAFQESISKIESQMQEAQNKLDNLRDQSGEAWNQAQDDLQEAMKNLDKAYEDAAAALDSTEPAQQGGRPADGGDGGPSLGSPAGGGESSQSPPKE